MPFSLLTRAALGFSCLAACAALAACAGESGAGEASSAGGRSGTGGLSGHGGQGAAGPASAGTGGAAGTAGAPDASPICLTEQECQDAGFRTPAGQGQPPPPVEGAPLADGPGNVQAIYELFLGDTDRMGNPDSEAWKTYGFDLDGWSSTPQQGFHCQPVAGGKKKDIQTDGVSGIDNSFGHFFVDGLLVGIGSAAPVRAGRFSALIELQHLGAGADEGGIGGSWWPSRGTLDQDGHPVQPTTPWAEQSFVWHPLPGQFKADGTAQSAFSGAHLAGRTLVASPTGPLLLQLDLGATPLDLVIESPRLALRYGADGGEGSEGTLGGILGTERFITSLKRLSGDGPLGSCDNPNTEHIWAQIRQMSDIMVDGTQDPTRVCDGISIGLGFSTRAAQRGDPAPATPPGPCDGP